MEQLPVFVNLTGKPVVIVGSGDAAEAKARLVRRAGGQIVQLTRLDDAALSEIPEKARLAFVALDDQADARRAADMLRARGLLVNAADRPELCDFTTPAIVDRTPVLVAISSQGRSAGLAKALRMMLERLLPARLGDLAEALFAARKDVHKNWPDGQTRRRAIDAALQPGGTLDPLDGQICEQAGQAVQSWLDAGQAQSGASGLHHIHIVSDDPDDLSLRQLRLLASADGIYHAPDIAPAILERARADAHRICLGEEAVPAQVPAGELWLVLSRADAAGNS